MGQLISFFTIYSVVKTDDEELDYEGESALPTLVSDDEEVVGLQDDPSSIPTLVSDEEVDGLKEIEI